jgi:hypothetical protein
MNTLIRLDPRWLGKYSALMQLLALPGLTS